MILEYGNMWDIFGKTDLFLVTTNPIVKNNGACVMGRGIAKQIATRFPKLPFDLGERILNMGEGDYSSCGYLGVYDKQRVGYFMVKNHWANPAELSVIQDSITDLLYAWEFPKQCGRIDMNFPGIGNGKLSIEQVMPLVQQLPDNVHLWQFKE